MKRMKRAWMLCVMLTTVLHLPLVAQTEEDEELYELSPFVIEIEEDQGYQATSTLAGTRVRTDLKDIASSISVVTAQFLKDTGATNNETLLQYTTNTEVGGIYGNFSGLSNVQGVEESSALMSPSTNTRVRGLDSADNTRNYFLSNIPWDGYNVDRVDLQRGPNSILFGVGSPAGIINTGTIIPVFENKGKVENRISTYGSVRNTFDYNHVLIEDQLAVRVAALADYEKYKQKPAFEDDERVYGTFVFSPDWFESSSITFRGNFEKGEITANRPRMLPPTDQITAFFSPDGLNRQLFDPAWAWEYDALIDRGNSQRAGVNPHRNVPWLGNEMNSVGYETPVMFIDNGVAGWNDFAAAGFNQSGGIGPDGSIDKGIGGFVYSRPLDIAGFNEYSKNANANDPTMFPSASKNFYKDKVLTDTGIFDFYNNLIDGDNKREWSEWTAYNFSVDQTFFSNRLGYELVYDYQDYEQGSESLFGGSTFLSVDINSHTGNVPTFYDALNDGNDADPTTVSGGEINPNAGRAYISGSGRSKGRLEETVRENLRFTMFGEFNGSDFFDSESRLARIIGRNVITALVARDETNTFNRNWSLFALDPSYAQMQGLTTGVDDYASQIGYAIYLSDDLSDQTYASGINLPRVEGTISPPSVATVRYFDSTWNSTVDPSAPYVLPTTGGDSTQSENPSNYVGWTTGDFNVLNAYNGDRDQLTSVADKRTEILDSQALTWQGYLFDGTIIPTYGWRKDKIETWGSSGEKDPITKASDLDFDNIKGEDGSIESEGETVSWGIVAHSPQWLKERLPQGIDFSVFYNKSKNFRAENRVGFDTLPLPNPQGDSEDYGIVVRALDNKLTFKVTWFTTEVTDANIPGGNALGDNVWFLKNIEAWGTAASLTHELFWQGELPGLDWFSNYGMVDGNLWGAEGWVTAPFSDEAINDPANQALFAAVEDWYATMPSQAYFDGYGLPIDVSKAQGSLSDRRTMVDNGNWDPYSGIGGIQPSGGGYVNGLDPTGTINQESTGIEFELMAQPTDNWNITVNVSKTDATRTDLGESISNFVEYQYQRFQGPAGDLRLWWGGDLTIRQYYDDFIYQAYLFQLDSNGSAASEIRPWRFNLITNYNFDDGKLKGANVGLAYRWQDDAILGYELNDEQTKLDIDRPIKGGAEGILDAWVGYSKEIKNGINWRIQLNLRNIGKDSRLIPISVNPDGEPAAQRIGEGMAWSLTNTITF